MSYYSAERTAIEAVDKVRGGDLEQGLSAPFKVRALHSAIQSYRIAKQNSPLIDENDLDQSTADWLHIMWVCCQP
jgi:hypothetical protein